MHDIVVHFNKNKGQKNYKQWRFDRAFDTLMYEHMGPYIETSRTTNNSVANLEGLKWALNTLKSLPLYDNVWGGPTFSHDILFAAFHDRHHRPLQDGYRRDPPVSIKDFMKM